MVEPRINAVREELPAPKLPRRKPSRRLRRAMEPRRMRVLGLVDVSDRKVETRVQFPDGKARNVSIKMPDAKAIQGMLHSEHPDWTVQQVRGMTRVWIKAFLAKELRKLKRMPGDLDGIELDGLID